MKIKAYSDGDEARLFEMLRGEGEEWVCYYGEEVIEKYKRALKDSRTYVAFQGDDLCGFARCRDDGGFGVYIYDLLVKKECRGHSFGQRLMERVCQDYPDDAVYVMSDTDAYYEKQKYRREGSIFIVNG